MLGQGRGRGNKMAKLSDESDSSQNLPTPAASGGSSSDSERVVRGRGGMRWAYEMNTIPPTCTSVTAQVEKTSRPVEVLANFVQIAPMKERTIYQYRVDMEPNIESVALRREIIRQSFSSLFANCYTYDGMSELRSASKTAEKLTSGSVPHPRMEGQVVKVSIKHVGVVNWSSFEMIRLYSMHAKDILRGLGFYPLNNLGAYINENVATRIAQRDLVICQGFRTAANVHMDDKILINLESCHKIVQTKNLLQLMQETRQRLQRGDVKEACRAAFVGKLVVTSYVKRVYKIEDIRFDMSPMSTFHDDKKKADVTYASYYETRYGVSIRDRGQPLVLVVPNQKRRARPGEQPEGTKDIYLVPELCNIAGLTEEQRNDNKLKVDLIRASQVAPRDKVKVIQEFLDNIHRNDTCLDKLKKWGYDYGTSPVSIRARVLAPEGIGLGAKVNDKPESWPKVDQMASFDNLLLRATLAKAPVFKKMAILVPGQCSKSEQEIMDRLRTGFSKISLCPGDVNVVRMFNGDSPMHYVRYLEQLPEDTDAAIVILPCQQKDKYDAIKKLASCTRGLITQVVTARLLTDQRKAAGAAVKIGIQLAAKLGGEPWYLNMPLKNAMVCGYDTHHDSSNRGRSYGAFVASLNGLYSRWFSKADSHDRMEEMSLHLCENLLLAVDRYRQFNDSNPERIFLYRDGLSDGDLSHAYNVELMDIRRALRAANITSKLTVIVVNKRVGARFFMRAGFSDFQNCPPGTVIDDVVTRRERFDFYAVSQSTRAGTVAPTYYNIIYDESGLKAQHHQAMAHKFCFLYYNWSGSVRVPAPCQYAHKLAYLCGEHLHAIPNGTLDDKLHFL